MLQRKAKRRAPVLLAVSLSIMAVFGSPVSAQLIPGLPPEPLIHRNITTTRIPHVAAAPMLYTDMSVKSRMHTVAIPFMLSSPAQYQIGIGALAAKVNLIRMINQNDVELSVALNNLAWLQEHVGDFRAAESNYREAIAILNAQQSRYPAQLAVMHYNMGEMYMEHHHLLPAMLSFRSSLQFLDQAQIKSPETINAVRRHYNVLRKLILAPSAVQGQM